MSKYIATVTTWTQPGRDSGTKVAKLLAAPLGAVGGLLLVSGINAIDVTQLAIGGLSLAGAIALAIAR